MSRISMGLTTVYFIITLLLISTGSIVHEALAFKLTASSFEDGVTKGMNDAQCDSTQCHGHGYDASCPSGHTSTFCRGYAQGYSQGWDSGSPDGRGPNGGTEDHGFNSNPNSDGGNNFDKQSSRHTGLGDTVCNLVSSGKVNALGAILAPLHLISGGTTLGILAAGHLYCALHGSSKGN